MNTMVLILVMLLLKLVHQAAVSSMSTGTQREITKAKLGEPLTLECTYNCSSGFTRGSWEWEDTPLCINCNWTPEHSKSGEMCSAKLYIPHLVMQQTRYNYSCVSEESDHPGLPRKTELLVTLKVQEESDKPVTPKEQGPSLRVKMYRGHMESDEVLTSSTIDVVAGTSLQLHCVVSDNKNCEGHWVRENSSIPSSINDTVVMWSQIKAEDGGRYRCQTKGTCTDQSLIVEIEVITSDGFTWAKIFAAFAVSAIFVLMAHLIYLCYRRGCKPMDTSLTNDRVSSRNAVVMRPVAQDTQSDHEVPYADIVISVRGSSHPDLSDTLDTSKLQRPKWKDEARPGLPYASSDRLHIHSKEVTRKLSTTSEYAVITYSCEALS